MKLILLGSGHGSCVNCYNTCFLLEKNHKYLLIDSGGGNQILKQLADVNIDIVMIDTVFISHIHMDHILGLIWIIRRLCPKYYNNTIDNPMYIYGNNEVTKTIEQLLYLLLPNAFHFLINKKIILKTVSNGDVITFCDTLIKFVDLHSIKTMQYGFVLKENNKTFSFIGDEPYNKNIKKYIENSDYLFADAYMCGKEADAYNPIKKHHHSTVKYTSSIAKKLNIKNLILSHTIDTDLKDRKINFIKDAKKYYDGNIYVPNDLEVIDLW